MVFLLGMPTTPGGVGSRPAAVQVLHDDQHPRPRGISTPSSSLVGDGGHLAECPGIARSRAHGAGLGPLLTAAGFAGLFCVIGAGPSPPRIARP